MLSFVFVPRCCFWADDDHKAGRRWNGFALSLSSAHWLNADSHFTQHARLLMQRPGLHTGTQVWLFFCFNLFHANCGVLHPAEEKLSSKLVGLKLEPSRATTQKPHLTNSKPTRQRFPSSLWVYFSFLAVNGAAQRTPRQESMHELKKTRRLEKS